jgi:molybdate transport system ATP-binding protein
VPTGGILLHRRDRPSRGEHENPISGVVRDFVLLGENANVAMAVDGMPGQVLFLTIPLHVAQRNAIEVGTAIRVSLLADSIHLMAPDNPPD